MRRTFIITALIIVLAGIGAVAYFYFFSGSASVTVAPPGSTSFPVAGRGTPVSGEMGTTTALVAAPISVSARLIQISAGPVVPGAALVSRAGNASSSPETLITFIERRSGNVFSYSTKTNTLTRTSNKTIPGIQSAAWLPNASLAFVRYLSGADFATINTYALPSGGAGGGFFLPQGLADIAVSSTSILMLASGVSGSTASLERTDGTRATTVFTTPLSALRIAFAGKSYLATTKASATLPGDAFLVDAAGHFSRVAGPLGGLVALPSPSGKLLLVSYTLGGAMQLQLVNVTTGEIIPLPVATIADKCVWTADDSAVYCGIPVSPPAGVRYPDDWYQGAVHFSDRIWKIQVAGRYAQMVLDFTGETKNSLDAQSLAATAAGTVLVFVNKNDGSLWSYSL